MSAQPFALRHDPSREAREKDFRQDLNIRLVCPDCQDEQVQLVEEFGSGDLVCGGCGLILGDKIVDTRSEWRSFADSEGDDPSRVGGPVDPLLDASEQFSTIISFKDGNSGHAKALQMAASRISKGESGGGRDLKEAFATIDAMCQAISLPKSIIDSSKQLFKRSDEEKLLRGKNINAIIAACIFIACRQGRVPRTFKEIVALTSVSKKDIAACFKVLNLAFETVAPAASVATADSYVGRYCNHLGLSMPVQSVAVEVAHRIGSLGLLDGRNPITVASAAILFATTLLGNAKPAKEIAAVAGVQDGTIRTALRLILVKKEALVDQKWFDASRKEGSRASWTHLE